MFAEQILTYSKKLLDNDLYSIRQNDRYLTYCVGSKALKSVRILQRFFRATILKKKLQRLRHTYYLIEKIKDDKLCKYLSKFMIFLASKFRIYELKQDKERLFKLQLIKERLAIIKIKLILKRKKLKVKTIRQRVRKYTRKLNSQFLMPTQQNFLTSTPHLTHSDLRSIAVTESKLSIRPPIEEEASHQILTVTKNPSMEIISANSEESVYLNTLMKEKVAMKLISYNIKSSKKSLNFLPLFLENDPESRPQTTKSTVSRINLINPLRLAPRPLPPKPTILKAEAVKKPKKYPPDETPPYMNDTKNSVLRYEQTPSPEPEPLTTRRHLRQKDSTLFCPTFSFSQRTKSSEMKSLSKPSALSLRPCTGPTGTHRRIIRSAAKSEVNIAQHHFEPPLCNITDMELQSIRPFFVSIKPTLSKVKGYLNKPSNLSNYNYSFS